MNRQPSLLDTASYCQGTWQQQNNAKIDELAKLPEYLRQLQVPFFLINHHRQIAIATGGTVAPDHATNNNHHQLLGIALAQNITTLGDPKFCQDYKVLYPYMAGSMANGIASVALVEALATAGLLASFGAAGLELITIEKAITTLQKTLANKTYCFNLIYSPNEPGHEAAVVNLYLKYGVHLVEASAYMKLTLPVVRYRVHGIYRDPQGSIVAPNRIIAKASRIEVASQWFSPPPDALLQELVTQGEITTDQAVLASQLPMAQDLTVEADSGGHTDNQPAITLLPTMLALRDEYQNRYQYEQPLRVGAAGGIATPLSALSAFAMGAAYIVTGTVNQACKESGTSNAARAMLAETKQADVTMAPAVDMFELGVKLQVLKHGTMFAMRGNKLYKLYSQYNAINDLPKSERAMLEKTIFKMPLEAAWQQTKTFFLNRDPDQLKKAEHNPKHQLALVFRWYLGLSSWWAQQGTRDRKIDYQIWCGPAMGAFNEWSKGTFLAETAQRDVVTVAMNILFGAAVLSRINVLKQQCAELPTDLIRYQPMQLSAIEHYLNH